MENDAIILAIISAEADATIRKFKLVKAFGARLRQAGIDTKALAASEIETEIRKLLIHPSNERSHHA